MVGLVVGPMGATIKCFQQQTETYTITQGHDHDWLFEITGDPGDMECVGEEIEAPVQCALARLLNMTAKMTSWQGVLTLHWATATQSLGGCTCRPPVLLHLPATE